MEKFKLIFNQNYFEKGDILETSDTEVEVLTVPETRYSNWFYRFLNWLTFRKFFNLEYFYTVKLLDKDV